MRTALTMQNTYKGPPESFAMVVPVPTVLQKKDFKLVSRATLDKIDTLSAPRLVEYWEDDPCPNLGSSGYGVGGLGMRGSGIGGGGGAGRFVKVHGVFKVGEYELTMLESNDATTLDAWLRDRKYKIPPGADRLLAPYIAQGMYFFVAKVDVSMVRFDKSGEALLSPLRVTYDSKAFSLPVRLGLLNANGPQDLIVYILSRQGRYEVSNYDNVTIPTNLDVSDKVKPDFRGFYSQLFGALMKKNPGAVVTEYAWDASKCDPCPGPQLDRSDLARVGGDLLGADPRGVTLTRLHTRYTKRSLGEDLIFALADPIVGGREVYGADKQLEQGASPGPRNAFQARYAIRHLWDGELECKEPRRGVWGYRSGRATAASGLNTRERAGGATVSLQRALRSHVPELGLKARRTTAASLER